MGYGSYMKSLQTRIFWILSLVITGAIGLIVYSDYLHSVVSDREKGEQIAQLIGTILEKGTAQIEHETQPQRLNKILEEVSHLESFSEIIFRTSSGKLFYKYQRDPDTPQNKIFRLRIPLINQPACHECHPKEKPNLGIIELGFAKQGYFDIFSANRTQIFILGFAILVLAISLGFLISQRFIIAPIDRLSKTIELVQAGDWDARTDIKQYDELGRLGKNFNQLIDRLKEREDDAKKLHELQNSFNAELVEKVDEVRSKHNKQLQQLTSANRLSATLITTFDRTEIMKEVTRSLQHEFGFEQILICILDGDNQLMEGKLGLGIDELEILRVHFPWESRVFDNLVVISGEDKMEKAFHLLNREKNVLDKFASVFNDDASFVILPLMAKNHLSGMLALNSQPYTTEEMSELLPSLKMLANQTALALENTQLYREVNRININLSQRVDEISTLHEIGQLLNSILDLEDLLELFIHVVTKEMKAEIGSIMLLNKSTNNLEIKAAKGLDEETIRTTKVKVGEGISGWVALNKEPLLIKDIEKDERFAKTSNPKYETKSLVCAPIISKEEVIGIVNINNRLDGSAFNKNDLDFLITLANQAAISLENAQLYEDLQKNYYDTIKSLILTLEAKDPYTKGHSQRVTEYVLMIAKAISLPPESLEMLEYASILHDIGKIGISEYLLAKKGKLTAEEFQHIQKHPIIGESILEPIEFLADIRPVIRHHHERFDGQGYPDHLQGDSNSLEARILSVADAYDAMTSNRPYREGLSQDEAISELIRNKGSQFDGDIVDIFVQLLKENKIN